MQCKTIKIPVLYRVLPMLFACGLIVFLCSCTKKSAASLMPPPVSQANTDTMPDTGAKKYLALGDSYTIGTSETEAARYPVQTIALLKAQGTSFAPAEIIATNGWTTANLLNAVKDTPATTAYDAVSLLIGVNNQYQGGSLNIYKQEFTTLLKRAVALANGRPDHVFVLSIPDYSVTPFASGSNRQKIAAEINVFNEANKTIAAELKVHYINVTEDSRAAATDLSLIASDGLHFSGKEYAIWATKLAEMIKASLP